MRYFILVFSGEICRDIFSRNNCLSKQKSHWINTNKLLLVFLALIFQTTLIKAQETPDFYLHENGVTVICTDAEVGDTGEVNGVTYTK